MSKLLLKYIKTGKKIERDGINFYKKALKHAVDINSKNLLKFLIGEEKEHLSYFESLEKTIKNGEKPKAIKKLKVPVFSKAAYKKIKGKNAQNVNIFNTALEMELESIKFYAGLSKKVKDADLKKFLLRLVNFEKKHYMLIKTHQDSLYNAWYWEAMGQERFES